MTLDQSPQPVQSVEFNRSIITAREFSELEVYAPQLVEKSQQPHIQEFELEDAMPGGRFSSEESIERWMKVPRVVYLLLNKAEQQEDDDLAGIVWHSPRQQPRTPGHDVTFGVRMYEGYVGKGEATGFVDAAHYLSAQDPDLRGRGLWLSADSENVAALGFYKNKLGYKEHSTDDGVTYMTKDDGLVV